MFAGSEPSRTILVGSVNGVIMLERDANEHWNVVHTALEGCHLHALLLEPASGMLFAGVAKGGVYVSADGGFTWTSRNNGLTQQHIFSLCAAKMSPVRVYAGTEPAHVFVTEDLGEHWTELPGIRSLESVPDWTFPAPPYTAHLKNFASDDTMPDRLYACVEQGCLLRSDDGGRHWTEFYGVDEDAHRIVIHPRDPNTLYLSTGNGIYRSGDRGERWKHITSRTMRVGYPDPLLIHPTEDGLMFCAGAMHSPEVWHTTKIASSAIARSRDGGMQWETLAGGLPDPIHGNVGAMVMEVHARGFNIFACGTDGEIFHSADGGDRWNTIATVSPVSKGRHYKLLERPAADALAAVPY
jgi:photosystem II stability/assembly factor-like uncharacterized protein